MRARRWMGVVVGAIAGLGFLMGPLGLLAAVLAVGVMRREAMAGVLVGWGGTLLLLMLRFLLSSDPGVTFRPEALALVVLGAVLLVAGLLLLRSPSRAAG